MKDFTTKELRLIRRYDPGRRTGLIQELEDMILYLTPDENRLCELARSVIRKLERMTGFEYHQITGHAAFVWEVQEYAG